MTSLSMIKLGCFSAVMSFLALVGKADDLSGVPLRYEDFLDPPQRSKPGILWFWSQTEMTDEVIKQQMQEMDEAGFGGVMMFPLQYKPQFFSEHFYERLAVVMAEAQKREMSVWLTVDSAIPTGHGAMKVVGGGKVNEELTLEPREDLRAQILLHGPKEIRGGRSVDLNAEYPALSNLPSTVVYHGNKTMHVRKAPLLSLTTGADWTDYTARLELTANNWAGNPLIVAGYIENGMLFRWNKETQSGYAWSLADKSELDKGGKGTPVVKRVLYRDGKIVRSFPSVKIDKLEHGKDSVLEVKLEGSTIETYVDGVLVDTLEDSTYTSGTVGLYTPDWCRSIFKDIKVTAGGQDLFHDDFSDDGKWLNWAPKASAEEVFAVAAIPKKEGKLTAEGVLDLTDNFLNITPWEAPAGDWKLEYFMKRRAVKMPYNYPDLFNDEVILRHQKIIYEEIYRRFPQYMGSTFKGFWSDEPHRTDDDVWSESFPHKFTQKGVNTAKCLAAVYNDLGREGKLLRSPYFQHVYEGWTDPFAKIQGEWCKERGLDWMTNPTCDSAPPSGGYSAGNALQMNQYSNAPGVDAIFGQILPEKRSYISRWATSSANQHGNQHVLYEVYGGYGWDVTPDLIRYVNSFLMVRGCNRVSYHAYWTNPEAVGYAPPFDPSNTYWHAQDEINLWNARYQEANLGKALSNVALLTPTSTQYADHFDLEGRLMNSYWGQAYYAMEDTQTCFDLIDESNLNDSPSMKLKGEPIQGGLKLGEQTYKVIVLPYAYTLSIEAVKTLKAMVEKGGIILAFHTEPKEEFTGRDAELQAEVRALFGETPSLNQHKVGAGWTALAKSDDQLKQLLAQTGTHVITVSPANPKIQTLKRRRANATTYLLMNESEKTAYSTVSFRERGTPEIWNPETGEKHVAPTFAHDGEMTHLPLILTPYQTKIVVFLDDAPAVPHLTESTLEATSVKAEGDRLVAHVLTARTGEHTMKAMHADAEFTGAVKLSALPTSIALTEGWKRVYADKPEEVKDGLGDWSQERPQYSGSATYTATFHFPEEGLNEQLAWQLDLGKVRDVADVTINGTALPTMLWRPYTADVTSLLKPGENQITVKVTNTLGNRHQDPVPSGLIGGVLLKPMHAVNVALTR